MEAFVSIIVPVYNARKYIENTIRSVEEQTYENWELILVDDGSIDGTREYLKSLSSSKIRVFLLDINEGVANARNKGINAAKGQYIAFLDADDLWSKEKIKTQINFMKLENANFSFTNYEFGDENAIGTGKIVLVPKQITYKQALGNTTIFTSTVMLNIENLGKERIKMPKIKSEDTATWWRLLREGEIGYGLQENLVTYRRPKKSLSSNKIEAIRRIWNLYRKQEKLGILKSTCYFIKWFRNAIRRRA